LIGELLNHREVSVVLASTSPRRKELLTEAGWKFTVCPPKIDESIFSAEQSDPFEYVEKLALAKAESVAAKYPDHLVIGADTIAYLDGRIIGKPADAEDAKRITKKLFSAPHKVITALAIVRLSDDTKLVKSDMTIIYPRQISEQQILEHIKSDSWQNKAGAYAIQQAGDEFVEKIEGSLTNVMGLPMELLDRMLGKIIKRNSNIRPASEPY